MHPARIPHRDAASPRAEEDIPTLVEYLIHRYSRKAGKKIRTIEKQTLELLLSYAWPGNIRELQNVIERSVIVCETDVFLRVWALAEGKRGELWVGTWFGGLFRFADGHFAQFGSRQGLADDIVRAITTASDGSLWIATEGGLSHMMNGQFRNYTTTGGLSSNRVVSVYQDRRGNIWAGTSRGVSLSRPVFNRDQPTRSADSAAALRSASPRNTVLFSPAMRAVVPVLP